MLRKASACLSEQTEWIDGSTPITSGFLSIVHFGGMTKPPLFADPQSEPIALPARFRASTTSHPVAASDGRHQFPAFAGAGSGERDQSQDRQLVRSPGSVRADHTLRIRICFSHPFRTSGSFHDCTFDHDAGAHVFPECNEQLAGQCHNHRLFQTTAVLSDALLEPTSECRLRLVPQP
ncbi:hypothetical protein FBZ98_1217 [Rhizobium sp. ERR 922]|nr:hypothetical protein FBZ98_1217 [Rhizobium sp. ERR 922]TWB87390.1 hypothetical protein FBZ97_12011 [Rhizobium sp. ERR 942]